MMKNNFFFNQQEKQHINTFKRLQVNMLANTISQSQTTLDTLVSTGRVRPLSKPQTDVLYKIVQKVPIIANHIERSISSSPQPRK